VNLLQENEEDYVEVKPKIVKAEKRKYTRRSKKVEDQVPDSKT
jgi:hypothetical protein